MARTGSLHVLVEAEGALPLRPRFFDEIPDVLITLERTAAAGP